MPFDIIQSINYMGDKAVAMPGIRRVAENPIYTAMFISIVIMLIVIFVFRNSDNDDPLYIMTLRTGFWTFLATTFIVFCHDKLLTVENETASFNGKYQDLFKDSNFVADEDIVPVSILRAPTVRDDAD